jgi:hypothetical protein
MKRILTTILLVTLLFPALAFGETINDLVKRDGLYYKKFTEIPFTGKITGRKNGSFKNGKEHGPWGGNRQRDHDKEPWHETTYPLEISG